MELGPVYLLWVGLGVWGRGVGVAQETLPERVLGEGLTAALLDEPLHDLVLRRHGAQDVLTRRLAVSLLCTVAAVQTCGTVEDRRRQMRHIHSLPGRVQVHRPVAPVRTGETHALTGRVQVHRPVAQLRIGDTHAFKGRVQVHRPIAQLRTGDDR